MQNGVRECTTQFRLGGRLPHRSSGLCRLIGYVGSAIFGIASTLEPASIRRHRRGYRNDRNDRHDRSSHLRTTVAMPDPGDRGNGRRIRWLACIVRGSPVSFRHRRGQWMVGTRSEHPAADVVVPAECRPR